MSNDKLPTIIETRGAFIGVTWYRALVVQDARFNPIGTIPEGTLVWARAIGPHWWSFVTELNDRFGFTVHESALDVMTDELVQQTYVLSERYWAEHEDTKEEQ